MDIILYRTRYLDAIVEREVARLRHESRMGVVVVTYRADARYSDTGDTVSYGKSHLSELPYPSRTDGRVDWSRPTGHHDLPLMRYFLDHPEYDRYWTIEDDVRFSGDWSALFTSLQNSGADLLMTTIQDYSENPEWGWWSSIAAPDGPPEKKYLAKGFGPFCALSDSLLIALDAAYRSGWAGHFEGLWPTVAKCSSLKIEDIGSDGRYTPKWRLGHHYSNDPTSWSLYPGTFIYRPEYHESGDSHFGREARHDMLWHPVKR